MECLTAKDLSHLVLWAKRRAPGLQPPGNWMSAEKLETPLARRLWEEMKASDQPDQLEGQEHARIRRLAAAE